MRGSYPKILRCAVSDPHVMPGSNGSMSPFIPAPKMMFRVFREWWVELRRWRPQNSMETYAIVNQDEELEKWTEERGLNHPSRQPEQLKVSCFIKSLVAQMDQSQSSFNKSFWISWRVGFVLELQKDMLQSRSILAGFGLILLGNRDFMS